MAAKLDHRSVIATTRDLVDDDVPFTSSELAEEFTLAEVARRIGAPRGAVRRAFNTVCDAADGVRLQKMDELFERWRTVEREGSDPTVRFRGFCDHLTGYAAYHFFADSPPVFRVFEERVRTQFAFDVLRLMAIQARADDLEISSLPDGDHPMKWGSLYENHLSLVLRSWGWLVRH